MGALGQGRERRGGTEHEPAVRMARDHWCEAPCSLWQSSLTLGRAAFALCSNGVALRKCCLGKVLSLLLAIHGLTRIVFSAGLENFEPVFP